MLRETCPVSALVLGEHGVNVAPPRIQTAEDVDSRGHTLGAQHLWGTATTSHVARAGTLPQQCARQQRYLDSSEGVDASSTHNKHCGEHTSNIR